MGKEKAIGFYKLKAYDSHACPAKSVIYVWPLTVEEIQQKGGKMYFRYQDYKPGFGRPRQY